MDEVPRLETEHVSAYYNVEDQTAWVQYKGVLGSEATQKVYQWMGAMVIAFHGKLTVKQAIFDFRLVTGFNHENMGVARAESRKLNQSFDFSFLPVALIVANDEQAQIVAFTLKVSGQTERSRIVRSEDEAKDFFKQWWASHDPPDAPPSPFS